ncbi:MAG: hypothetical protein ACPHRO_11320, partial [Nannocystaceae bacterium]
RTGGTILLAITSLSVLLVGGAAVFQLKRAELTASERDHLLHLTARTQTEMAAAQLNGAIDRAVSITRAMTRRQPASPSPGPSHFERDALRWLEAEPSLLEVATPDHPGGPVTLGRDALNNMGDARGEAPVEASRGTTEVTAPIPDSTPSPPLPAPRVKVLEKRLTSTGSPPERRPTLELRALVSPADDAAPDGSPWSIQLRVDLSVALRALTRGPGHRFGHLAVLTSDGAFAWGPTQRYDDGGGGWVEISDATIAEACERWRTNGAAPDRFTPFHHDGHTFAVGGRTLRGFTPDPATICIVLPRRDFTQFF